VVRLNEADHHVGAALLALVAFLERSVGLAHAGSHAYQIGHGRRIEEAEHFYRRHPRWSLFGKMLRDSAAALDALGALPFVDPGQMWVVGYSLGALVGLHLCALDRRPAGLAAVCLPPPFRTDTDVAETGGFQRWARRSLLLLRLGYFEGHASQIPYDLDELLAALAPRPTLVVSPTLDHEAPLDRVTQAVERARVSFASQDAAERLAQVTPLDYNRFVPHVQNVISTWLRKQVRVWQGSEWPLPWRRGAG
jgi:pimeloyl-ACP methyl ester carboxylesterase